MGLVRRFLTGPYENDAHLNPGIVDRGDRPTLVKRDGTEVALEDLGNGGDISPPVDFQGTDPAEAVLTLRADPAQTQHVFRVYNLDGDLVVDVDNAGILDTKSVNVQDPPDVGPGPGGATSHVTPGEWRINSGTDPVDPMTVTKWDGVTGYRTRLRVKYSDTEILALDPIADEVSMTVAAPVTPTGNAIELWDNAFDNLLFAVTYTGGVIFSPTDPHVAGAWWDNAGILTRSAG